MRTYKKAGFTLMEMIIVIAIVGILISIIIPTINYARRRSLSAVVVADISAVEKALDEFKMDHGFYPPKPTPTRPMPDGDFGYNRYIWYALVNFDLDMDDSPDVANSERYKYLEFPDDKFDSNHMLTDPWETPYGLLLPIDPRGWDVVSTQPGWPKDYRIWSNGPDKTTDSSNPGMGDDDFRNVDFSDL